MQPAIAGQKPENIEEASAMTMWRQARSALRKGGKIQMHKTAGDFAKNAAGAGGAPGPP